MEPNRFGRKLGIGVRVASRMVKERAASATPTQSTPPPATPPPAPAPKSPTRSYVEPARRVGEGTRRFSKAFVGPLAHVSRTLWFEITGLLFALFALFFAQNAWKLRGALHQQGPDHTRFLLYCAVTLIFLYFSGSSFWKSARATRQRRRAQ